MLGIRNIGTERHLLLEEGDEKDIDDDEDVCDDGDACGVMLILTLMRFAVVALYVFYEIAVISLRFALIVAISNVWFYEKDLVRRPACWCVA